MTWDTVAVSTLALLVSGASFIIAVLAFKIQGRSIDLNNCLEVSRQISEAQRRVRDATDEAHQFELIELMNLLELLAKLVNRKRLGLTAAEYTTDILIEAWAWIRSDEGMMALVDKAITGPDTFGELVRLANVHKPQVDALAAAYRSAKSVE